MKYKLFTYGTLMKGQCRHHVLQDAKYLGDAVLRDYCLLELGSYPGAIRKERFNVYGEVYEIPEKLVPELDRIEGEGYLYERKTVDVTMDDGKTSVLFYEFLMDDGTYEKTRREGKWNTKE